MDRLLTLILLLALCVPANAEEPVPAEPRGKNGYGFILFPPSGYWGDWVFLLQGFYSGLDGFGLGLETSRPFDLPLLTKQTDVELEVKGRMYEDFHGELQASADATFGDRGWSVRAHFRHSTRLREFWGIGPDVPEEDDEEYRPRNARLYLELLRHVGRLRIGVRAELHDYQYLEMEQGGLLETGGYTGVSATGETIAGGGLTWDYDSRDDRYVPTRGWRVRGNLMLFDVFKSGESGFTNSYLDVRTYRSTSPENVFAFQAFTYAVNGDAPIAA